jgi:hypothetical protein
MPALQALQPELLNQRIETWSVFRKNKKTIYETVV